jgi:uncharacterized repeat protein (TIGR03837 family)
METSWDIFCKVVDNFGDAGVTWRLARQLAHEHSLDVRLWIDDLGTFARLCPAADPQAAAQTLEGVQVCAWQVPWKATPVASVVIEAFNCTLPAEYEAALAHRSQPALWINLDYLSAEAWVGGCHGLPSMKSGGLRKFFFFPGFREDTGGLLRERNVLAQREAFQGDPQARAAFLEGLGIRPVPNARLISLFAYENDGLAGWLDQMASGQAPVHLLVPEGRVLASLEAWAGRALGQGATFSTGALQVHVLPFLSQQAYDRLLWACDFNAVRGEDSFVRAQWAARPLLWHIYRQDEYAHWEKLEAFLDLYTHALPEAAGEALRALWRAWNMDGNMAGAWAGLDLHWEILLAHARRWCAELATRPDLATALVQFRRNSL